MRVNGPHHRFAAPLLTVAIAACLLALPPAVQAQNSSPGVITFYLDEADEGIDWANARVVWDEWAAQSPACPGQGPGYTGGPLDEFWLTLAIDVPARRVTGTLRGVRNYGPYSELVHSGCKPQWQTAEASVSGEIASTTFVADAEGGWEVEGTVSLLTAVTAETKCVPPGTCYARDLKMQHAEAHSAMPFTLRLRPDHAVQWTFALDTKGDLDVNPKLVAWTHGDLPADLASALAALDPGAPAPDVPGPGADDPGTSGPGASGPGASNPGATGPDTRALSVVDALGELAAGEGVRAPTPGRAAATIGATSILTAVAALARIGLTRPGIAAAGATVASASTSAAAPPDAGPSPAAPPAQPPQQVVGRGNLMHQRRAALSAGLRSARQDVARLIDRRAALDRLYEQTRAAWDYGRYTGVSDGVINIVDLGATLVNPSASTALAGLISATKQAAKIRTRSAIAVLLGISPRHQPALATSSSAVWASPRASARPAVRSSRPW